MSLAVVRKLIALAADERGNLNERQNAALKAVELMKREGYGVHNLDPWDVRDREYFPKDPRFDCTCSRNSDARGPEHAMTCAKWQNAPVDYSASFRVNIEDLYGYHSPLHDDFVSAAKAAADGQREAERRRWEAIGREDARRQRLWEEQASANDPKVQAQRAYAKGFDAIDWGKR